MNHAAAGCAQLASCRENVDVNHIDHAYGTVSAPSSSCARGARVLGDLLLSRHHVGACGIASSHFALPGSDDVGHDDASLAAYGVQPMEFRRDYHEWCTRELVQLVHAC